MNNPNVLLLLRVIIGIAVVNFATFMMRIFYFGGDALNGHVQGSHFYLGSHGKFTEVSETVFNYSALHARSTFVTHPLGMLAGFLFMKAKRAQQGVQADVHEKP